MGISKKMAKDRFQELDVFRGVAAFAVMLFHFSSRYPQVYSPSANPGWSFDYGHYGVQLFFMISGFVIFLTLSRCRSSSDFLMSRFSRLFPAYWAALLLTAAVGFLWPLPDQHYGLAQLLINTTMLQSYLYVPSIDGVYWTLSYELGFYAVMLALYLFGVVRHVHAIVAVWLALALSNAIWPLPFRLQLLTVLPYAPLFMAGLLFHEVWMRRATVVTWTLMAACLLGAIGLEHHLIGRGLMPVFFLLFGLAVTGRMRWLLNRPLLWLGSISYTLYLVHQMLGFRVIAWLEAAGWPINLAIAVAMIAMCVLATALTHGIEQPTLRGLRQWYQQRWPLPTAAVGQQA
jgi:peptidoglycan/LPS O-acetylase OafA/YrhL